MRDGGGALHQAAEEDVVRCDDRVRREAILYFLKLAKVLALGAIEIEEIIGPRERGKDLSRVAQVAMHALRDAGPRHHLQRSRVADGVDFQCIDFRVRETLRHKKRRIADGGPYFQNPLGSCKRRRVKQ